MAADFRIRSYALAGLAIISAPLAANPPPDNRSTAIARAAARIERPVLLRNGRAARSGQDVRQTTRERACHTVDVPEGKPCRLVVTDLE